MDACSPSKPKLLSAHYDFMKNDSVAVFWLHLRARGRTASVSRQICWVDPCFPSGFMVIYPCDLLNYCECDCVDNCNPLSLSGQELLSQSQNPFLNFPYSSTQKNSDRPRKYNLNNSKNLRCKWILIMYNFNPPPPPPRRIHFNVQQWNYVLQFE